MSEIRKVGKTVKDTNYGTNYTFTRDSKFNPTIVRIRDVFDSREPYTLDFEVYKDARVTLDLTFKGPPQGKCCTDCFCTSCDKFTDNSEPAKELTFPYLENTVKVFKNLALQTDFTETSPDTGVVTLNFTFTSSDIIRICYIYQYTDNCTGDPTS